MPRVKVLITCTQPRADGIIHDLKLNSIDAYAMPALNVEILDTPIPEGKFDVMLITSTHAFEKDLPRLPVIAVGAETARLATQNGFNVVKTGVGGVDNLDISGYTNILYPCAYEPTSIPCNATAWTIYATKKNNEFKISNDVDLICVFSVKAAKYIKKYDLKNKIVLCLSKNIETEFSGVAVGHIASCTYPRYDAMKQLIDLYLRKHT